MAANTDDEVIILNPYLPFWAYLRKEILRFLKMSVQTLLAPMVSVALYLFIFGVTLGNRVSVMEGLTYAQFVIPGLILMGVIANSFANTSSSLFMLRYLGGIVDFLVTPISPGQFIGGHTIAAIIRGVLVGGAITIVSLFFTTLPWTHPVHAIIVMVGTSFLFSQLGLLAALVSNNFETLTLFNSFVILPLTYLGGLFYPTSLLSSPWNIIARANPLLYLIDGFRLSLLGVSDTSFEMAVLVGWGGGAIVFAVLYYMVLKGIKLRT